MAHVALADDAALCIELRDRVGTVPDAILAPDAGFRRVEDDAGNGILFISVDGAAAKAVRGEAVIASHGEVMARSGGPGTAFDLSDAPPVNVSRVSVLFVACDLAGATADALCHIEVESILLSGEKLTFGNERGFYFCRRWRQKFEAVLRQAHDGVGCVGVCEFVKMERHNALPSLNAGFECEDLVDVAVVAVLIFELLDVFGCGFTGAVAVLLEDGV
jgi:hypothetical protein